MRDIKQVLERWGAWAAKGYSAITVNWPATSAPFRKLMSVRSVGRPSCSDDDGMIIDACVARLRQVHKSEEQDILVLYYVLGMDQRAIARAMDLSRMTVIRRLETSEGFVAGCLSMNGVKMEMDPEATIQNKGIVVDQKTVLIS